MKPLRRGRAGVLLLVLCAGTFAACGKKGPPLPPLARVPAPPANPQAVRVGDDVYISFVVPAANVSGQTPADVATIELYAFTGLQPPAGDDPMKQAVKVGAYSVQPILPAPPPPPEGAPTPPPLPAPPGFVQGAQAVVKETLTPDALVPTPVEAAGRDAAKETEPSDAPAERLAGPLVAPSESAPLKRFYFLVAQSPRGRASTPTAAVSVPLQPASQPPTGLALDYTESAMSLKWTPSPDARAAVAPPDPALLASKPLTPVPPATTYHVFEVTRDPAPAPDPYSLALPTPLTPEPVAAAEVTIRGPVQYGTERCFVVRAVDTIAGVVAVGPGSEPACITPRDTFPPAPPQRLAAIAGVGVINLIWEPNTEADLAGYIVLRGTAAGGALQALTDAPVRETTYRDETVRPGERYVYAVVAVDNATPQNVSGQSNRVEESSRAPR